MRPTLIYLHGFASGPKGTKAAFLREQLAERGITMRAPDLNRVPDFEHLTVTGMIARVAQEVADSPPGPVYVIASSLGAFVALHFLDRRREVEARRVTKLMLLAPALAFADRYRDALGAEVVARWQEQGTISMYHYAYQQEMPLGYGLAEDAAAYSDGFDIDPGIPTRILHGLSDTSVPVRLSERYAAEHRWVSLRTMPTDHQMLDHFEVLWKEVVEFFELKA